MYFCTGEPPSVCRPVCRRVLLPILIIPRDLEVGVGVGVGVGVCVHVCMRVCVEECRDKRSVSSLLEGPVTQSILIPSDSPLTSSGAPHVSSLWQQTAEAQAAASLSALGLCAAGMET